MRPNGRNRKNRDTATELLAGVAGEAQKLKEQRDLLREAAEAFRVAMIESGATAKVSQDTYFDQLRALETAIAASR